MLQDFLKQQRIDAQLATAVKLQVRMRVHEMMRPRLKMADVAYLKFTSSYVQEALKYETSVRHITRHTLLAAIHSLDCEFVRELCSRFVASRDLTEGDLVFEEGVAGDAIHFVINGELIYTQQGVEIERARPPTWLSEPALWTLWTHIGSAEAAVTSEVLHITAPGLQAALEGFPDTANIVAGYCSTFHAFLQEPGHFLSDLPGCLDYQELLARLPQMTREMVAEPIFERLRASFWAGSTRQKQFDLLREEVRDGKCNIGLVESGEVVRTVCVLALMLRQPKAHELEKPRFLVQIGELRRGASELKSSCVLPATKLAGRESSEDSVQRILSTDFELIRDGVITCYSEGLAQSSFMKESPSYGIRTRYLRTTVKASLEPEVVLRTVSHEDGSSIDVGAIKKATCSRFGCIASSRAASQLLAEAAAVLQAQRSVVVVGCPSDKKCVAKVYLWLSEAELTTLSSEFAAPVMEQWVRAIDVSAVDPATGCGECRAADAA